MGYILLCIRQLYSLNIISSHFPKNKNKKIFKLATPPVSCHAGQEANFGLIP